MIEIKYYLRGIKVFGEIIKIKFVELVTFQRLHVFYCFFGPSLSYILLQASLCGDLPPGLGAQTRPFEFIEGP